MPIVRLMFDDAPDVIPVPEELRHRQVECIFLLLDEVEPEQPIKTKPKFNIAVVDNYDCLNMGKIGIPSRDERNARR